MPKTILLIDDEPSICKFTKLNLEQGGEFEVTVAFSGEDGLRLADARDFDLVITDFRMPGMDGKAVLQALKAKKPTRPVILFSVYHDDLHELPHEIRRLANGMISKPIDHDQLQRTIHQALEKSST